MGNSTGEVRRYIYKGGGIYGAWERGKTSQQACTKRFNNSMEMMVESY